MPLLYSVVKDVRSSGATQKPCVDSIVNTHPVIQPMRMTH